MKKILFLVFIFIEPIEQPQNYYNFSDKNNYFSINNFWNVISNIPFIIIVFIGIVKNENQKLVHDNLKLHLYKEHFF